MKNLVIVESPTKAKTISKFLGHDYKIISSYGHVRDLPKSKMGIDIEHDFAPHYVIPTKARKHVDELKSLATKAENIYFATDEDREGEAITWHLQQIFKVPDAKVKRITFHEITKPAILKALEHPRGIDNNLVDAQQARRILDRLVGYELSPFLWKKVARGLSAGRVQSVAVRLIVEREEEITSFKTQEYWTVDGLAEKDQLQFEVSLHSRQQSPLKKFELTDNEATAAVKTIKETDLLVSEVVKSTVTKKAPTPLTTSALQIEANHRFGFSTRQTMMLAQDLYEGIDIAGEGATGLITYMRTDSVNLAPEFTAEAADYIRQHVGKEYALATPRSFSKRSKLAQEAHEAIRPTLATRTPEQVKPHVSERHFKLYSLIWSRSIASQMAEAEVDATTVTIDAKATPFALRATGSIIKFPGWMKVYATATKEKILPELQAGDQVNLVELAANQHFTEPPARYSEAGLVKALEAKGIGRPSTYAPTIATIVERKYVDKEHGRLKPTDIGTLVTNVLKEHFADIVDYDFTADMEDSLDKIAEGKKKWQPIIAAFYHPFKANLEKKEVEVTKKALTEETTDIVCEKCGQPMVIKMGRFGKFLACSGYPDCKNTKQVDSNGEVEKEETTQEVCEKCGQPMVIKHGRFGKFLGCSGYPECKNIKAISKTTGVKCPKCNQGDIVEKKSKRGKIFYSCDRYPDCDFALWQKPTDEKCPDCGSLLVFAAKNIVKCSNADCKFKKDGESPE
ncbi:MAG: type I DNA topoisomerase [Candidatus Komeilibacteria bacterium]